MAKLEEDGSFELQQKRWNGLIDLRQAMTDHEIDPAGVELAISNVFDPKQGHMVDSMILDGRELMAMILQLEELQIASSNVKMALGRVFIPGMTGAYDADLLRLKEMIKMREQMARMGIPTGCIEATIAEKVLQPRSRAAETVKPEELSGSSATKLCPVTVETIEPAELDASATAIFQRSTAEIGKLAELEPSETAVTTQSPSSTGAGKPVETPARPTEMKPVSKDKEIGKPAEMPSQPTAMNSLSTDAEHITIIRTSIEAMDLGSSPTATAAPLKQAPSVWTGPSTVHSAPLTKTPSRLSSPSTTRSRSSAKRSAPADTGDALGSAQNPICLGSSPPPKRQKTAKNITSKADRKKRESWKVPIQSVTIMGLHLKPREESTDMSIVFDAETQRIVFYKGHQSLTALYSDLEVDPEALLSVTRPTYAQSKQLKVRFMWLNTDTAETFLDIMVATKQDCRELITRLKTLTSFSEILVPEPRMNRLCGDATWLVNETQNAVGLSVTKFSENVWLD